jgi:hypothetical protein
LDDDRPKTDAGSDDEIRRRTREEVSAQYDDAIFCPKCGRLLTGMHTQSAHFQRYIDVMTDRRIRALGKGKP